MAAVLPYVQLLTGLCLFANFFRPGANMLAVALLGIFTLAQFSALIRGLQIDCGCFGATEKKVTWMSFIVVAGLTVAAAGLGVAASLNETWPNDKDCSS